MAEKEPIREEEKAQAGQEPTQELNPTPTVEPAVKELQQRLEQVEKQIADKDRFITELQAEKQTLESRLSQVNQAPLPDKVDDNLKDVTTEILETAQVDPDKAGEKLAGLIKTATTKAQEETLRNLEPLISRQTYVNEVKAKNKDLIELGLEPAISLRTQQLIQTGKGFKEAVDAAVQEARQKVEKLKSNVSAPPPKGAVGEGGSNREPAPPPSVKEKTPEDEIREERERRAKMGL